ncbi:MAG TPA: POTRA domain-containing protein, partial [Labilithrix sp.]
MRRRTVAIACAWIACASPAAAQPIKTWGSEPPDQPPPETPPPPPTTTAPEEPAPEPSGVVRAEGKVGLRYVLEGVQVRGNTATLSRVILRYVPFHAGDTIDVDDKELLLTRFRLLGTGFFRDVQLSLRRGTKRGNVVLVVDVEERNTVVINDMWLGLSADAEPNGQARPLTAYGGIDVSETNLAGTGVALGGAIALADRQVALRTRFGDPQFLGSSWSAEAQLLYNNAKDFFGNRDVLVYDPTQLVPHDYAVAAY